MMIHRYFISSDGDKESNEDADIMLVDNKGLRRKRKPTRKITRKAENVFGKGRQVNDVLCKTKCKHNFTEIQRHNIHEFYWSLGSYDRQRNWLY